MSPPPKKGAPAPTRIDVRMYQVGFGDCFLLSFGYDKEIKERDERHVLIDFGSFRRPKPDPPSDGEIVEDIAKRSGGKLDAIVVTHRHKDHLSAFGSDDTRERLEDLEPELIVRPWTENPDLDPDAPGPKGPSIAAPGALQPNPSLRLVKELREAEKAVGRIGAALADQPGVLGTLGEFALRQVKNKAAVDNLDAMTESAKRHGRYLHAGEKSGLEQLIPGVEVTVLGPPTPEEWPDVAHERDENPEYWLGLSRLLDEAKTVTPKLPAARAAQAPGPTRWLLERIQEGQIGSLQRIVRRLDKALNNTSVVLLFKAGKRRLLFSGDAQIENWSYALRAKGANELREDLPDVDLYKVGHHGSRNGTPRSLVELWKPSGRLTSLLSTLPGAHNEKSKETAVPRGPLVAALEELGPVERTDALPAGALYVDVTAKTTGKAPFKVRPAGSG